MATYSDYSNTANATTQWGNELDAYMAGLTTPLSSGQQTLLNTFITSVKTGFSITDLDDAFDCIWILAGETEESSLRNLVKNSHHCQNIHSTAFTAFEGFIGDGANDYLNTNYNQANQSVRYLLDSASFGLYCRTNSDEAKSDMGLYSAAVNGITDINLRNSNVIYMRINSNLAGTSQTPNTDSRGIFVVNRTASNDADLYRNKLRIIDGATNSTALVNLNYYICARCQDGPVAVAHTQRQYSFAFIARGLSPTEINVLTDAIEAYMDANGKGVIT